jgi:uncharacterized protein (TIGR03067 family)
MRWIVPLLLASLPLWAAPATFIPKKLSPAIEAELKALQGEWELVSLNIDESPEVGATGKHTYAADRLTVGPAAARWRVVLDPAKTPKTMDLVSLDTPGLVVLCTYKLEGARLHFCHFSRVVDDDKRPTTCGPGESIYYKIFKRKRR